MCVKCCSADKNREVSYLLLWPDLLIKLARFVNQIYFTFISRMIKTILKHCLSQGTTKPCVVICYIAKVSTDVIIPKTKTALKCVLTFTSQSSAQSSPSIYMSVRPFLCIYDCVFFRPPVCMSVCLTPCQFWRLSQKLNIRKCNNTNNIFFRKIVSQNL